ncbi:28 kDa heat- and acid-stable phosphoprotein [Brachypodium distachyon]|uniref:Casein kinase substrate phosphoprotein PP28 domain-containing protein n=1 Tax=Brachypodium distachyon TaxID=15368 RepID=I1HHM1_BRADI|nr:28 kDa heat- and acid-stable phosphoprotein [Brachypodium distachyon]KQK05387.1 hypothetical protein BRADI_2g19810v3 [Brachypodium distachyon]|eukprot:XP_003568103.1 28 kDa heat- and acid-stable phosphoprotein [Brachypodium distachyon]
MAKGKFKGKPTGQRTFSSEEELAAGTSAERPNTFKKKQVEKEVYERREESIEEDDEDVEKTKHKGTAGLIEIDNPNLVKPKNIKAKDVDVDRTSDLSRREREELEKQRSRAHYMRLQEEGKTEQARKDLDRLTLIKQQREEAAKKREEEKAAKEARKAEARK